MRLWTLHPQYLDARGLVALWREALLAKAVLCGKTRGYRHHPQLMRFREHPSPRAAINAYLAAVHAEATARGYAFDCRKIGPVRTRAPIAATKGQIDHERRHLMRKLAERNAALHRRWKSAKAMKIHPLFRRVRGPVADWERS